MTIRNLTIEVEQTGKRIPVNEVEEAVTAGELLIALSDKINLPPGTRGVLRRRLTHKTLLPEQSLKKAGVEDGEVLIADFQRTAG